jgi:hypothetical protein
MGSYILSEGWNTSTLRVGPSSATTILSTGHWPLGSCPRAALLKQAARPLLGFERYMARRKRTRPRF